MDMDMYEKGPPEGQKMYRHSYAYPGAAGHAYHGPARLGPVPYETTGYGMPPPVVTQPVSTMSMRPDQKADWKNGLCGCCNNMTSCCCGCFCPCCFACSLGTRFDESCCYGYCCQMHLCLSAKTAFRMKHNIQGSFCQDACEACCCPMLVLCQVHNEMNLYGYKQGCCI